MRALGLALIAALAIGCSATPTSPTSSLQPVTTVVSQDAKQDHTPNTLKVTIFFYTDDLGYGGQIHVVGMPVILNSVPAGASVTGATGKQGSISIDVPKTSTSVNWEVPENSIGWCPTTGTLELPYEIKDNWFAVHYHPSTCSF